MKWPFRRNREPGAKGRSKMLVWALVLGFLYGLAGGVEYFEDGLRVARNRINEREASGDIVLVGIDEKALKEVGRWPWPRGRYADLVDAIGSAKPERQVHDIMFPDASLPAEDAKPPPFGKAAVVRKGSDVTADEAIAHYRASLRGSPEAVDTHVNLAVALQATGAADEAIGHYERALQLNPAMSSAAEVRQRLEALRGLMRSQ